MDDPSQLHHDSLMMDEEEIWVRFNEKVKELLNIKSLWLKAQKCALEKLNLQLNKTWMDYLSHLFMMDETSIFSIYRNFVRRMKKEEEYDECVKLGCFDYL